MNVLPLNPDLGFLKKIGNPFVKNIKNGINKNKGKNISKMKNETKISNKRFKYFIYIFDIIYFCNF
jgi:hypothetical protein